MPDKGGFFLRPAKKHCRRKITWSHSRGACRFQPNHTGPCKPEGR